ncbi:MsnO8 family LLM class oxidoreductase [Yinghuangia sp. YIM S09857]|uniref:MsnO8 family LLM class oxidoreductase n=1 Tax=Yinghuangia sp. YIM S09857 TaxID=3436929 RepID=UPI003F53C3D1
MTGMPRLRLSVLDQSPVGEGSTPADALAATVTLAREADELGYHRFWTAEHHGTAGFAGTAPEILTAILLERTRHMRIGTGGVLLPRYEPAKVAEVFRVLAALHPGRVDLGVGRAGGPAHDFPTRVRALLDGLAPEPDDPVPSPPVWLLGAGTRSARLAGELGTNFAFAHFFNPGLGAAAFEGFGESDHGRRALAVRVVAADTDAEAAALADAYLLWRSRKDLGHDEPHPSVSVAARHRWTDDETARAAVNRRAIVHGTGDAVAEQLTALARAHGVGELVVNTLTQDPEVRLHSYRLLAKALL